MQVMKTNNTFTCEQFQRELQNMQSGKAHSLHALLIEKAIEIVQEHIVQQHETDERFSYALYASYLTLLKA
jgi:hypothetical protein